MRQAFGAQFATGVFGGGEQGFPGQIQAQPRRENQRGTGARREAVLHVRADVAAFGAEQTEVSEHAQRPAAADGMPLHRGDDRQLAAHRQLVDLRIGEFGGALLDRQQTLACAAASEVGVVAGEHHGAVGVGGFDMREHRFQPMDQFGRVHVLRIAIDHAHHDHAVAPHLDVDGGGLRRRRCGAGRCRRLAVGIRSAVAFGGSRRLAETAPLAQQRGRTQRRGFGKRQCGRQHVGVAARDDARGGFNRIAVDGGGAEQALPGQVVAQTACEPRHRLPQQCGMLPERSSRALAAVAVDAGVGAQAEQPADAVGIVFESDDDRCRERRQGRLQRHQCGHRLRSLSLVGIQRQPRQKAGEIAAQHHRGMAAGRQCVQGLAQTAEQHRLRRVACAEADRSDAVGQHLDRDARKRCVRFARGLRFRLHRRMWIVLRTRLAAETLDQRRERLRHVLFQQAQRFARLGGHVRGQRQRDRHGLLTLRDREGPALVPQRASVLTAADVQQIVRAGATEARRQQSGFGQRRMEAVHGFGERIARLARTDHEVAERTEQEAGSARIALHHRDGRQREPGQRAIQPGVDGRVQRRDVARQEAGPAIGDQQHPGVRAILHVLQRLQQLVDHHGRRRVLRDGQCVDAVAERVQIDADLRRYRSAVVFGTMQGNRGSGRNGNGGRSAGRDDGAQ